MSKDFVKITNGDSTVYVKISEIYQVKHFGTLTSVQYGPRGDTATFQDPDESILNKIINR